MALTREFDVALLCVKLWEDLSYRYIQYLYLLHAATEMD